MPTPFRSLSPLAFLVLTASVSSAWEGGGACPTAGACHLSRWAPPELGTWADFGAASDLAGDTAVVGAPAEDAVYVYRSEGGVWSEVQRLDSPAGDGVQFGHAVCLDGDELVIGAPTVNNPGGALYASQAGAAYVYERGEAGFELASTLLFSFPTHYDRFGTSVAKQGDRIAVGAPRAWYTDEGTVAVFERDGSGWTEVAALMAPEAVGLGSAVALDGDRVIGGDEVHEALGEYAGRVFWWEPTGGGGWSAAGQLPAPGIGPGAFLGTSLAAAGGWVAAGAYGAGAGGEVRLYRFEAGSYVHAQSLTPCNGTLDGRFGRAVDLDAARQVVGADLQSWPGLPSGRAHVYRAPSDPAGAWELEVLLQPSDGAAWDGFGRSAAVDGPRVLVGANRADPVAEESGAAYLVSLQSQLLPGGACPCDVLAGAVSFGAGKPGAGGVPQLALTAAPVPGEDLALELGAALPGAQPLLVWGLVPAALPFDAGELYVGDPHLLPLPVVSAGGVAAAAFGLPADPGLCGVELALQAAFFDAGAAGPLQTAQSNGVLARLGF
ncbi:MAG: FG-GAP repeat protein [Planctomycetota bacterium]